MSDKQLAFLLEQLKLQIEAAINLMLDDMDSENFQVSKDLFQPINEMVFNLGVSIKKLNGETL